MSRRMASSFLKRFFLLATITVTHAAQFPVPAGVTSSGVSRMRLQPRYDHIVAVRRTR